MRLTTNEERVKEVFDTYPKDELTEHDVSSHSGVSVYNVQEILKELAKKKTVKYLGKNEYSFKKFIKA